VVLRFGIYSFIVTVLCILLLAGNIIYLLAVWGSLPEQIPGHYDFAGNVTRYDGKGTLLVLPVTNIFFFILFTVIERFPKIWNTGVRITEENRVRVYRIIKNMLVTTKFTVIAAFVFMSINQSLSRGLSGWFMGVFFWFLLAPIIFFIIKLVRAR